MTEREKIISLIHKTPYPDPTEHILIIGLLEEVVLCEEALEGVWGEKAKHEVYLKGFHGAFPLLLGYPAVYFGPNSDIELRALRTLDKETLLAVNIQLQQTIRILLEHQQKL
jgi:hypothetical protein